MQLSCGCRNVDAIESSDHDVICFSGRPGDFFERVFRYRADLNIHPCVEGKRNHLSIRPVLGDGPLKKQKGHNRGEMLKTLKKRQTFL